jgi:SulP family sulfate permease
LLARTRFSSIGAIAALIIPTLAVSVLRADSVARVRDAGAIPSGLPLPALPGFGDFSLAVLTGGIAVAVLVLVQGAGVAQSAPNPGGSLSDANQDFVAQGLGNIASSVFNGQPVGGSVGQTALNISSGARTRWAAIFSGMWMLLIVALFSRAIGLVAQPTLAALLIVAGIGSIRPGQIAGILKTGLVSQIALGTTFAATLFLPVATAVGIGVALSLLLQLNREALDLRMVELSPEPDGQLHERPAPTVLQPRTVMMLDVYGSLLYAGSRTLQVHLPDPAAGHRSAVVIRLRGRTQLGSTFFLVVDEYADRLENSGGRLFLSGVDPTLLEQFTRAQGPAASRITVMTSTEVIGESSRAAYARATRWVVDGEPEPDHANR